MRVVVGLLKVLLLLRLLGLTHQLVRALGFVCGVVGVVVATALVGEEVVFDTH